MRTQVNFLRLGLKSISRKDSSQLRTLMFKRYQEKFVFGNWLRHTPVNLLVVLVFFRFVFCLVRCSWKKSDEDHIWVGSYEVEQKALLRYCREKYLSFGSYSYHKFSLRNLFLIFKIPWANVKVFRYAKKVRDRHGLLVLMRQVELIFHYSYHIKNLKNIKAEYISSTESNPEIIGLMLAAAKRGAKTRYIPHGYLNKDLGIFFQNIIVAESENLKIRIQKNSLPGSLFEILPPINSIEKIIDNIPSTKTILVVGSILPSVEDLLKAISFLEKIYPNAQIKYRPHPNELLKSSKVKQLEKKLTGGFKKKSLEEDVEEASLVFGGETSCLLYALQKGKIAVHLKVDEIEYDQYGFVSAGLIPSLSTEICMNYNFKDHYLQPSWLLVAKSFGLI